MNLTPDHIHQKLAPFVGNLAAQLAKAAADTVKQGRGSSVTLSFRVHHDKDAPNVLVIEAQSKIKSPRGPRVDVLGRTEVEEVGRWKIDEDAGQQQIGAES